QVKVLALTAAVVECSFSGWAVRNRTVRSPPSDRFSRGRPTSWPEETVGESVLVSSAVQTFDGVLVTHLGTVRQEDTAKRALLEDCEPLVLVFASADRSKPQFQGARHPEPPGEVSGVSATATAGILGAS